jgi:hypothetical protein
MRVYFALALLLLAAPSLAFERVKSRDAFLAAVVGKDLTGDRVRLRVGADGSIAGRGFGLRVTGEWRWADGMFCRTLRTALRNFPENCQTVARDGATLRFTSDRGQGDVADLVIR